MASRSSARSGCWPPLLLLAGADDAQAARTPDAARKRQAVRRRKPGEALILRYHDQLWAILPVFRPLGAWLPRRHGAPDPLAPPPPPCLGAGRPAAAR